MASSVLALDVGDVRIGVAIANAEVRFPRPLTTLANNDSFWNELHTICEGNEVTTVVVGLPRGLDGQETGQTAKVRDFVVSLQAHCQLPIILQDEATTSVKAETELKSRGKPYEKSDIDALAATYILEDYLNEAQHV